MNMGQNSYLGMCLCVVWSADFGEGSVIGSGPVVVKPAPRPWWRSCRRG